jgi:hypothetical protein
MELPKPMLIALEPDGRRLAVELDLVGFASECFEETASALVHAWRQRIPDVAGSRVVDRQIWGSEVVAVPKATAVILEFTSPLETPRFKGSGPASAEAALWSLLSSLGNRVSGLARWQDADIEADWPDLKARASGLELTCSPAMQFKVVVLPQPEGPSSARRHSHGRRPWGAWSGRAVR